jgi:hypothetical protein
MQLYKLYVSNANPNKDPYIFNNIRDKDLNVIPQDILVNELYENYPDKFINLSDFNKTPNFLYLDDLRVIPKKELYEEEIVSLNEKELILYNFVKQKISEGDEINIINAC